MLFVIGDDVVDKHFSRILLLDYNMHRGIICPMICQPVFCFCCTVCVNMAELSARSR